MAHELLEGPQGAKELLVQSGPAANHVVAVEIAHRQRVAPQAVAQKKPALVVDGPDVVGMARRGQPRAGHLVESWFASRPLGAAMPAKHPRDGAAGGQPPEPMRAAQQLLQLLRAPGAMLAPLAEDQLFDLRRRLLRAAVRSPAAFPQTGRAFLLITAQPLVAGLPAHLKVCAQLRHRELAGAGQADESMLLFHEGYLVPGHSLKV